MGDLNVSPWSAEFRQLLKDSQLRDSTKGFGLQPTWPTHVRLMQIPIDHLLYSSDIKIIDRRVGPNIGSDHYPLIVDLQIPKSSTLATEPENAME